MENTKRVMGEKKTLSTKSLARIANNANWRNSAMTKGKSSISDVFVIKMKTTHYSDTSRRQAMILLGNE